MSVNPVEKSIKSLKARFVARKLKKRLKGAYVGFAQNIEMLESKSFDAVVCLGGAALIKMFERGNRHNYPTLYAWFAF